MNKHTAELLEKHFDTAFTAPDGIKKLRELILTLAMQGRLISQDVANNLIELKNLATKIGSGSTPSGGKSAYKESGIPLIRSMNVHFGGFKYDGLAFIDDEQAQKLNNVRVETGDVLLNITGASIGRVTLAPVEMDGARVNQHVCIIRPTDRVLPRYLELCLASPLIQDRIFNVQVGATREALTKAMVEKLPISLPSIEQQYRIVAKIDELMARCDELEKLRAAQQGARLTVHAATIEQLLNIAEPDQQQRAQAFLAKHFGELYTVKENVAELRKAILQLAVMGKLVPQNPSEQPASELLKEIEAEKQRLVQAKKIKRPKPVPSISQDNEPFPVPDNWQWVRIAELAESIDYGTSQKTCDDSSLVPVYRMGNIVDGRLIDEGFKYISPEIDELPRLFLQPNDILFNRTNSYELVGKSARYTGQAEQVTFASYLIRVRLLDVLLNPVFMSLAMNAPYFRSTQIEPEIVQQCGQANFNGTKLSLCVVPLPPLAEQHRIIAKIDELMALCDLLEQNINTATSKQTQLLNALVYAQSQDAPENQQSIAETSGQKSDVIDLTSYRAAIGCYALNKLANAQYFGRTAAAKVMYLAQAHIGLALDLHPERKAAGPLDKWIYGFERLGLENGWFEVQEIMLTSGRKKAEYRCLPALSVPVTKAESLMSPAQQAEFDRLIYAIAGKTTEQVEIIATLFAVWNDFLLDGIQPTDEQIIREMRENWHERKARFSPSELAQWLDWLRKEQFIPKGQGPRTIQQHNLCNSG